MDIQGLILNIVGVSEKRQDIGTRKDQEGNWKYVTGFYAI